MKHFAIRTFTVIALVLSWVSPDYLAHAQAPAISPTPEVAVQINRDSELATPRLVVNTFLNAVESIEGGDESAIARAMKCLDLQEIA